MSGPELAQALERCGWHLEGQRPEYKRYSRHGAPQIIVPLDPDADDYAGTLEAAVATLEALATLGMTAARALALADPSRP